ncbi:MAG: type II and III secretion system protein family protein [Planctomycetota bacterium]|jgi:pilus assembly protein CpaC
MHKTKKYQNAGVTVNSLIAVGLLVMILAVPAQAVIGLASDGAGSEVSILHRQSQILQTKWPVARVAVTDPAIADIKVLTADQVLIQGLKIGTTDILRWIEDETQVDKKKVNVPQSSLQLSESGENLIIRGSHRVVNNAAQLQEYLEKSSISFIDMTDVAGVQQVQLQVRIAEVSKSGLRSLGINWFQAGNDFSSGISPGGSIGSNGSVGLGKVVGDAAASVPGFQVDNTISGSGLTAFGILPRADMAFFLDALAENQYLRLLANPTLVALNGEEAGFLAGGEFPVPVVQSGGSGGGSGGTSAISIEYKEYGVRLTFKPIVLGDGTIRLYASPEVSELDYANGTTVNGTSVPGVLARKAQTTVELKSGQSFAMAGLLSNSANATNSSVAGLGDLPVLGPLFRSVRYQNKETELVILVTANLVEPLNIDPEAAPLPGFLHEAPSDWELYINGNLESQDPAKLNAVEVEWLTRIGLSDLKGPGAWDNYDAPAPPSQADIVSQ